LAAEYAFYVVVRHFKHCRFRDRGSRGLENLSAFSAVMPRLDRGIQYAAASRFNHSRLGVLDRPVKPGDDTRGWGAEQAPKP
jgi:hypothetical protein